MKMRGFLFLKVMMRRSYQGLNVRTVALTPSICMQTWFPVFWDCEVGKSAAELLTLLPWVCISAISIHCGTPCGEKYFSPQGVPQWMEIAIIQTHCNTV